MIARNCLGKIELRIGDYFVAKNSKGKYEIMKNMPWYTTEAVISNEVTRKVNIST